MNSDVTRRAAVAGGVVTALAAAAPISTRKKPSWVMEQGIAFKRVRPATRWLLTEYGDVLKARLVGTTVSLELACAIACQESAYTWFDREVFKKGRTPADMMRLMVLDNSQESTVFPQSLLIFRHSKFAYIADELILIADASRVARGYKPTENLLYGYGLFQLDLQHIEEYPHFWRDKHPGASTIGLWGDVGVCTDHMVKIMSKAIAHHPGDLKSAVVAYNGGGKNAPAYAEIVIRYLELTTQEVG